MSLIRKIFEYLKGFSAKEKGIFWAFFALIIGSYVIYNTFNAQYMYWWSLQEMRLERNFARNPQAKANVVFVVPNLQRIGASIMYARLISLLKEHNYHVAVLYNDGFALQEEFAAMDVPVFKAPMSPMNYDRYISFLKNHFDFCIVSGEQLLYAQSIINKKIPTIWWLHEVDIWIKEFAERSEEGSVLVNQNSELYEDELWYFDPIWAIKKTDVVAVSNLVREALSDVPEKSVRVINNGVSEKELADSMKTSSTALYQNLQKQNSGKMTFTYVGRVVKEKGVHVLLQAFEDLPEAYKDKMMLYIVGSDDEQYAKDLQEKYRKFHQVIWTGEQKQDTLWDYYRTADVMIVPSVRNDAAPCVVTEASMYHMPSIITENVGSDYLIDDGKSGFIVKPDDVNALKETLMWAIDHPTEIKEMGEVAHQKFLQTSTPQVFWKSWEEAIREKLQEK